MNINEAMEIADQMKPNTMERDLKLHYLTEIDQMIYREILMKHWHRPEDEVLPEYTADTDSGQQLLVPDPYSKLYPYYLMSEIDLQNREMDMYNNDRALFETAYENMSDWWTREHRPITKRFYFRF